MRLHKCPNCPAMLNRYQKRSHARLYCPATKITLPTRTCANTRRECTTTFTVNPHNPYQEFCSKRCWNAMRDAPRKKRDRARPISEVETQRNEAHMAPLRRRQAEVAQSAVSAQSLLMTPERSYALWVDLLGLKTEAA